MRCASTCWRQVIEQFLERYGAEMLVETARFWVDLGFLLAGQKDGKFCIHAVTGPDEYNTVVNNNAYTNLMARENLRYAVETVQSLRSAEPEAYAALVARLALMSLRWPNGQRGRQHVYPV